MKRNLDLVRLILLSVEGQDVSAELKAFSEEAQIYHAALLVDAGYVDGTIINGHMGQPVTVRMQKLTWAGHDFIDAIRSDSVWKPVKEKTDAIGAWTFGIVKELAVAVLKQQLNLS
jgi:hypothetical protein